MSNQTTAVHVTHEATGKIGGIGAVLEGLFTSKNYQAAIQRSILVCPLFSHEGDASTRLGESGEVLYSSIDGLSHPSYYTDFNHIEEEYNVDIIYGRRIFEDHRTGEKTPTEVILIDVGRMEKYYTDQFKEKMFVEFGIRSDLHEHVWDYEQWVRLGPPAIAAPNISRATRLEFNASRHPPHTQSTCRRCLQPLIYHSIPCRLSLR